jgi:uncharacterized membrane protein
MQPVFTNDAIVLGLLIALLALVFHTSRLAGWQKFYSIVPSLLLCYFLPALLHWPLGLIAPEWFDNELIGTLQQQGYQPPSDLTFNEMKAWLESQGIAAELYEPHLHESKLYAVATRYLLPASLLLLCLGIDFKGILQLGPKAGIMFLAGTLGVVLGGPFALLLVTKALPADLIPAGGDELWQGLSAIAGSWIGGGGNQTAMKEIFQVNDTLFGTMVVVDVVVANIWMAFLLYGAGRSRQIDRFFKADDTAIENLKNRISAYRDSITRVAKTSDMMIIAGVAFGGVALSHWAADTMVPFLRDNYGEMLIAARLESVISSFFWIVMIATTAGLLLSFTKLRELEGVGASNWGSVFIYVLVAVIGMRMNLREVLDNMALFAVGIVWMLVHVLVLVITARLIRAPFFFLAVGSQANIGGAASAPIMASAFSPSLAPVGVLLAVLGYALGTYGGLVCAYLMQMVSG